MAPDTITHTFVYHNGWPGSIVPPEDGQGMPETCRDVLNKIITISDKLDIYICIINFSIILRPKHRVVVWSAVPVLQLEFGVYPRPRLCSTTISSCLIWSQILGEQNKFWNCAQCKKHAGISYLTVRCFPNFLFSRFLICDLHVAARDRFSRPYITVTCAKCINFYSNVCERVG
jgi:hypothetical protein